MSTFAALVVLALGSGGAVHLEWDAPAGCPSAAEVSAQIDAHLAGTPRGDGSVEASAKVTRRGGAYVLELRSVVRDQPGARTLRGRECGSLARAAALVVALAVDPSLGERQGDDEGAPVDAGVDVDADADAPLAGAGEASVPAEPEAAATEPEVTDPEVVAPTTAPPSNDRRGRLRDRFALRLLGGAEVGALPGVGGLVGASIGHVWPRARVELTGVYLPPRRVAVPYEGAVGSATFQLGAAGARGCGQVVRGRFEVPLCAGIEAGVLDIVTADFRPDGSRRAPWVAGSAGATLVVRALRVLGVVVAAELVVPFTRPTTIVGSDTSEVVHRPAPVTGRFAAGIELRFP
ncbi:MAG: hypothetical protein R3B09_00110 [Nannocystaceae bacterium]